MCVYIYACVTYTVYVRMCVWVMIFVCIYIYICDLYINKKSVPRTDGKVPSLEKPIWITGFGFTDPSIIRAGIGSKFLQKSRFLMLLAAEFAVNATSVQ